MSPSGPKNTARWLLSTPCTVALFSLAKNRHTSDPIRPDDPVTSTFIGPIVDQLGQYNGGMPPRYAYWTILVDGQPTAFRASSQEDLMPTFKRLKEKNDSAEMMWFQNGKLWPSRTDAQDAMRMRGERGRERDVKQGGFRDRKHSSRPHDVKTSRPRSEWSARPKTQDPRPLEWKPKGEFTPAPRRSEKPDWKPKGSFDRDRKPAWKPKRSFDRDRKPAWKPKDSSSKLEWQPKGESRPGTRHPAPGTGKPREARRDKNWRPGGEHKDPRQKYKDAKKAKWTRFKKQIRTRWESKQGKKRKDEE